MKPYDADVIIIGSGLGGATTALVCAKAGLKTLVLERGDWPHRNDSDWNPRKMLVDQSYAASDILVRQYGASRFSSMRVNEVAGGASVFYGAAAFRFREKDFSKWPISYQEFEPFYSKAENLLNVAGENDQWDPMRSCDFPQPSPKMAIPSKRISNAAKKIGLSPARIPLAINFDEKKEPNCALCNTCDGFPCKVNAKLEGATILAQAKAAGAEIRTGQVVKSLSHTEGKISSVEVWNKNTKQGESLRAKVFVLAAGAIQSPAIALHSGLGNGHAEKWVGKNLMRHCNGILGSVIRERTNPENAFSKQICLFDFYDDMREKLGTSTGVIQDIYMPAKEVVRHFAPTGFKVIASTLSNYIQNLLCVAEDDPQESNQITLSQNKSEFDVPKTQVHHSYTDNDYLRRDHLLKKAKTVLRAAGGMAFKTRDIDSFSHAVGTLRFANSPSEGALDLGCRFHESPNLYAIDGSFFPTSGGVNPSLTIVANAMRAAEKLTQNMKDLS